MSEALFPQLIGCTIERSRSPVWNTTLQQSISGHTVAVSHYSYPLWNYRLQFEFLRSDAANAEWQALLGLFNRTRGRADTFLFDDEDDNRVEEQVFGKGDGQSQTFQLVRELGDFIEPVLAPKADAVILQDGLPINDIRIDRSNGQVCFVVPPPAGSVLAWRGGYYWRCRFNADTQEFQRFFSQFWSADSVEFTTVKA